MLTTPARSRGRPREFDIDEALDQAVGVFCERGYHATSISHLTQAMALASGSVYKAFKDKRAIFLAAFDRYKAMRHVRMQAALAPATNGRDQVHRYLRFHADSSHGEAGRRGCLVVGTATELALFDAEVADRVKRSLAGHEAGVAAMVRAGQADGSLSPSLDPVTIARLMVCVIQGMHVVGKDGRTEADMYTVADAAMKVLD